MRKPKVEFEDLFQYISFILLIEKQSLNFFLLFCNMWFKRKHVSVVVWELWTCEIFQKAKYYSAVYVDFGFYLCWVWSRSIFVFKYIQDIFGGINILVSDVLETRYILYRYSMTENTSDTASIDLTEFTTKF